MNINSFKKTFLSRTQPLNREWVDYLRKHSVETNNVYVGLSKNAFGVLLDQKDNILLHYIKNDDGEIKGILSWYPLKSNMGNKMIMCFVKCIIETYGLSGPPENIFNTFQQQVRGILEHQGYTTFDDVDVPAKKYSVIFKVATDMKGLFYTPSAEIKKPPPTEEVKKKNRKSSKPMQIYLMKNKRNGFTKIGKSINPNVRERTLQSEEPQLELIFNCIAPATVERELHTEYAEKRIRGEWFDLTEVDIQTIVSRFNNPAQ